MRKTKSFGPFRMTMSKSGMSYSVGGKGMRYTVRADGKQQITTGIPGSGLYYTKTLGDKKETIPGKANSVVFPSQTKNIAPYIYTQDTATSLEDARKEREQVRKGLTTYLFILLFASPILLLLALVPVLNVLLGILGCIPFFIYDRKTQDLDERITLLQQLVNETELSDLSQTNPHEEPTKYCYEDQSIATKKTVDKQNASLPRTRHREII